MLNDIRLTYGALSVIFRNWRSADLPRSRVDFSSSNPYSTFGTKLTTGVSFTRPYFWNISAHLTQIDYDALTAIWEAVDYSRRNDRAAIALDVNITSNLFSSTAHPYQNNDLVFLFTTGSLPAPLVIGRDYYIVQRGANSFKLSETLGGAEVDITTAGSNSSLKTQIYTQLDDESEEIFERGATLATLTRSIVSGTTPRLLNGGVYSYGRFQAEFSDPPKFGRWGRSQKAGAINCQTGTRVCPVDLILEDTRILI